MISIALARVYEGGWTGYRLVAQDGPLYLGVVYVDTTVTLALREYNLPNAVSPWGWEEHTPCWQR